MCVVCVLVTKNGREGCSGMLYDVIMQMHYANGLLQG